MSRRRDRRTPARPVVGALAGALLLLAVAGCSGSDFTSGDKGFVSVDKTVSIITEAGDRPEPQGEVAGETLDGDQVSLSDHRGRVVVIPVWGSWCGPCQKEAPWVVGAAEDLGDQVRFVGINVRDGSPAQAQAFERNYGVEFPSLYSPDGEALLAFHGVLTPRSIPAFVVLDRDGRIAASIVGPLPSQQTLVDLTQDVVDEASDGARDG